MIESNSAAPSPFHSHVFLGEGHEKSERKTWTVIWLCGAMMIADNIGNVSFKSRLSYIAVRAMHGPVPRLSPCSVAAVY